MTTGPNQSWSIDFVSNCFVDGRRLRSLNIVDDFTKECLAIEVDTFLSGRRVVSVLARLAEIRGLPRSITVDNGPEFISKFVDTPCAGGDCRLASIHILGRISPKLQLTMTA
jgi:putative transposase